MADITSELKAFKEAYYGEEVRNALVSAMNKVNTDGKTISDMQTAVTTLTGKVTTATNNVAALTASLNNANTVIDVLNKSNRNHMLLVNGNGYTLTDNYYYRHVDGQYTENNEFKSVMIYTTELPIIKDAVCSYAVLFKDKQFLEAVDFSRNVPQSTYISACRQKNFNAIALNFRKDQNIGSPLEVVHLVYETATSKDIDRLESTADVLDAHINTNKSNISNLTTRMNNAETAISNEAKKSRDHMRLVNGYHPGLTQNKRYVYATGQYVDAEGWATARVFTSELPLIKNAICQGVVLFKGNTYVGYEILSQTISNEEYIESLKRYDFDSIAFNFRIDSNPSGELRNLILVYNSHLYADIERNENTISDTTRLMNGFTPVLEDNCYYQYLDGRKRETSEFKSVMLYTTELPLIQNGICQGAVLYKNEKFVTSVSFSEKVSNKVYIEDLKKYDFNMVALNFRKDKNPGDALSKIWLVYNSVILNTINDRIAVVSGFTPELVDGYYSQFVNGVIRQEAGWKYAKIYTNELPLVKNARCYGAVAFNKNQFVVSKIFNTGDVDYVKMHEYFSAYTFDTLYLNFKKSENTDSNFKKLIVVSINDFRKELQEYDDSIRKLEDDIKAEAETRKKNDDFILKFATTLRPVNDTVNDGPTATDSAIIAVFNAFKADIKEVDDKCEAYYASISETDERVQSLDTHFNSTVTELEKADRLTNDLVLDLQQKVSTNENQIQELTNDFSDLQSIVNQHSAIVDTIDTDFTTVNNNISELQNDVTSIQEDLLSQDTTIHNDLQNLSDRVGLTEVEIESLKSYNETFNIELEEHDVNISTLDNTVQELSLFVYDVDERLRALEAADISNALSRLDTAITALENRISAIEEQLNTTT